MRLARNVWRLAKHILFNQLFAAKEHSEADAATKAKTEDEAAKKPEASEE